MTKEYIHEEPDTDAAIMRRYLLEIKAGIAKEPNFTGDIQPLFESLHAGMKAGNPAREWERVGKAILAEVPGLRIESWADLPMPRRYVYTETDFHKLQAPPPALLTADGKTILIGEGQVLVYAPTRSFKSFVALHWAKQLAADGKRVLFCVGERFKPFAKRSRAYNEHYEYQPTGDLHFADVLAMHLDGITIADADTSKFDVVFVDTFRSAINPEDENSNSEIGKWLRTLRKLASLVVVIHHTNKGGEEFAGGRCVLHQYRC